MKQNHTETTETILSEPSPFMHRLVHVYKLFVSSTFVTIGLRLVRLFVFYQNITKIFYSLTYLTGKKMH